MTLLTKCNEANSRDYRYYNAPGTLCMNQLCVAFGIVNNLAISVLFRIAFIDKIVKDIFPAKQMIDPYKSLSEWRLVEPKTPDDSLATRKNTEVADGTVLAVLTEVEECVLDAGRTRALQLYYEAPVLLRGTARGIVRVNTFTELE